MIVFFLLFAWFPTALFALLLAFWVKDDDGKIALGICTTLFALLGMAATFGPILETFK